jgi:hypothetical protein
MRMKVQKRIEIMLMIADYREKQLCEVDLQNRPY